MNKSKIITIGGFDANAMPVGWEFECGPQDDWFRNELITDSVKNEAGLQSFATELMLAGWRFSELREIADLRQLPA